MYTPHTFLSRNLSRCVVNSPIQGLKISRPVNAWHLLSFAVDWRLNNPETQTYINGRPANPRRRPHTNRRSGVCYSRYTKQYQLRVLSLTFLNGWLVVQGNTEETSALLLPGGCSMEMEGRGGNDVVVGNGKVHQDYHLAVEIPDTAHQISQGFIFFSFLCFQVNCIYN